MSIPCVICGLGADSYCESKTINETEYQDGESLRKHLVIKNLKIKIYF